MSHDEHDSPMDHGFTYAPFLPRDSTPDEQLVALGEAIWRHGLNLYALVAKGVVAAEVLAHWNSFAQTHPRDCGSPVHYLPNRRGEVPAFQAAHTATAASSSARHVHHEEPAHEEEEEEHERHHEETGVEEPEAAYGAGRGRSRHSTTASKTAATKKAAAKKSTAAAAATAAAPKKAAAKKSTTAAPAPTKRVTRSSAQA